LNNISDDYVEAKIYLEHYLEIKKRKRKKLAMFPAKSAWPVGNQPEPVGACAASLVWPSLLP